MQENINFELKVINPIEKIITVAAFVDSGWSGGRYQVSLSYNPARKVFIVSAPNYWASMETTKPHKCANKISEHGISRNDALTIEAIVNQLLLPALRKKMDAAEEFESHVYSHSVMGYVRQNLDLEANDDSKDMEIAQMSRNEVFDCVLEWNGFIGYGSTVRDWVEGVYGVKLSKIRM